MAKGEEFVCGVHAVLAALARGKERALRLIVASGRGGEAARRARALAESAGVSIETLPPARLSEFVATSNHQGMVLRVRPTPVLDLETLLARQPPGRPPLLLLDGIQDPRNLGALLRTAVALGAGGAVWPKDRASGLTPTVAKAAAGALESLPLARVTNMARAVSAVKDRGYWAVAGDPKGENTLGETPLPAPAALVLGAEGRGIRRLVRERCDVGVRITLSGSIVGSLNVVVAAAIFHFAMGACGKSP